ncbi:hypothetical protein B0H94_102110 [Salsuginibacillus halophilus]|uniref:Peptidyl-prolyl cis-trans isomerase n=1 Tax=Salsuginibacillus halophilus TaxID=517424 RepID=A0A2P8HXC1_9BACI|nr:hypothetical protein [Salsuginibacillus halophilus]PSL50834.1 hypothetical protein B0H94_102110 [Salsuginibacillus halophilus]
MDFILRIQGNVNYPITIDPTVWIFDDRKVDLTTFFDEANELSADKREEKAFLEEWERARNEGARVPERTQTNEVRTKKEALLQGTFGMALKPFLENAEPTVESGSFIIETLDGEITVPLPEAYELILGFSQDGKPLRDSGPVHVYYRDGSNRHEPITHVQGFRIE